MPVINFQGPHLTAECKREFIQRITDLSSEITHIPAQFFTVVIHEFNEDSLGVGGETVADFIGKNQQNI